MTKEEKELLLKDLCARLPYGVKIRVEYPFLEEKDWHPEILYGLDLQKECISNTSIRIEEIKPYLFPLSSMTEEQKEEYNSLLEDNYGFDANGNVFTLQDFYCKHHLDYRGFLIPMKLAIDCTNLNIY